MPTRPHLTANLPVYQCYDCCGCGTCCGGNLAVSVTPAERDRIVAQGWPAEPDLVGRKLFIERGERLFLAHRDDGCCVFLGADGLCRIHGRFGSEGKPLACRYFPHVFLPAGNEVRVDLRFDCHRVAASVGTPISGQRAYLEQMLPLIVPAVDLDPPAFRSGVEWPQKRLDRLTEAFGVLLGEERLNLTQRLAGVVNLVAALDNPKLESINDAELDALLAHALAKIIEAQAADPLHRRRLPGGMRTLFRQQLGLYGRVDRIHEPVPWTVRMRQAQGLAWGRGLVPALRQGWPKVRFRELEGPWGVPDAECAEAILRYLRVKLDSQAFCGLGFFGYDYLPGLNMLWLTFPAILWFARFFARGDGRDRLAPGDVHRALQVVDHRHGRTPQMALPGERKRARVLCEREVLRGLVVWYGT
jgi:lysine-N-methylase